MSVERVPVLLLLLLLPCLALAGRTPGFSMSAFNAVIPDSTKSAVCSPYAFEIDSVVISEAFGPIEKSKFVEALGVLVGYENVYRPIADRYASAVTKDFRLVSARAFLASSLRLIAPRFRSYIQSEYNTQACSVKPSAEGAESYFRAAMDGEMEDFKIPAAVDAIRGRGVSFVDLESFRCHWAEPFPTANSRQISFVGEDGVRSEVPAMADVRAAELWETDRFTMLRLPMCDGAFFHAVLPASGNKLSSVREDFAADKLDTALVMIRSITDPGVYRGSVAVVLPKITIDTVVDLSPAYRSNRLPIGGFNDIDIGQAPLSCVLQRVRFVLDESGPRGRCVERKSVNEEISVAKSRRFICNRPCIFFVYHEPTRTIPVAGVFAGGNR